MEDDNLNANFEPANIGPASEAKPEIIENDINSTVVHSLDQKNGQTANKSKGKLFKIAVYIATFLIFYSLGLTFYWYKKTSSLANNKTASSAIANKTKSEFKKGQTIGVDSSIFKDTAQGLLEVNKEKQKPGTHILIRGDASQTVYLTSSILDLNKYVNHKVKVWGETQSVQGAGWFMDIGKLEILE